LSMSGNAQCPRDRETDMCNGRKPDAHADPANAEVV
jgi:hypothetical protein